MKTVRFWPLRVDKLHQDCYSERRHTREHPLLIQKGGGYRPDETLATAPIPLGEVVPRPASTIASLRTDEWKGCAFACTVCLFRSFLAGEVFIFLSSEKDAAVFNRFVCYVFFTLCDVFPTDCAVFSLSLLPGRLPR